MCQRESPDISDLGVVVAPEVLTCTKSCAMLSIFLCIPSLYTCPVIILTKLNNNTGTNFKHSSILRSLAVGGYTVSISAVFPIAAWSNKAAWFNWYHREDSELLMYGEWWLLQLSSLCRTSIPLQISRRCLWLLYQSDEHHLQQLVNYL